jgi:Chaperone of endosialidase
MDKIYFRIKVSLIIVLFAIGNFYTNAQVGINVVPTSTLDVAAINATGSSTNVDGILFPRVSRLRAQSMVSIPTSTVIYVNDISTGTATGITADVTSVGFYFYNGTKWVVEGSDKNWSTTGNTATNGGNITTAGTNFIGTTDAQNLDFRTNNVFRSRFNSLGYFGLQNLNPLAWIHFSPTSVITNFQSIWDNNLSADALARFQHTNAANGSRVLFGITNYNASAFTAAAIIGLSLNTSGSGGVGVQGVANGSGQIGVFAANQNPANGSTTGWGIYSNNFAGGVTAWSNVSDRRLKKNISNIPNALNKVLNLRGVEYFFDTEKYNDINLPDNKQYGFIAQEVEEVLPEIVRESIIPGNQNKKVDSGMSKQNKNYNFKTLSYSYIIPVLVEGMKEQQKIIESQNLRLEKLEKLINNLQENFNKDKF